MSTEEVATGAAEAEEIAKGVAEAKEIDPLGPNVVLNRSLMAGSTVLEVTPSGASAWVKTIKIDTQIQDGTVKSYFKKVQVITLFR
ncbi:uncharacterized protein PG986_001731 [Apiospora aurea]|uniref:Uncharacterized protein n=1 Tax=Apiospora aurea TaxID=335848 RepID=A0ABR1QXU6_9PEZI